MPPQGRFRISDIEAPPAARRFTPDQVDMRTDEVLIAAAEPPTISTRGAAQRVAGPLIGVSRGFLKEGARRIVDLGRVTGQMTGLERLAGEIPPEASEALGLDLKGDAEEVGGAIERGAEFLIPAGAADQLALTAAAQLARRFPAMASRLVPRAAQMTGQALVGASEAVTRGENPRGAAALAAAIPVAGGVVSGVSQALKRAGPQFARRAIKPTLATLRKLTGSGRRLDQKADEVATFIIEHRLMTADQARRTFQDAERELQALLSARNAPTDAATRAGRYLQALEQSATKQGLPASDVAAVRNAAAELVRGPMGEDIVTLVAKPHPRLVDPAGQPISVLMPETRRRLRGTVPATEALESARSSGRWSTRKVWGEQKGVEIETRKAVERAQRDALKAAVAEARPLLKTEGQALTAAEVLDRMAQRQGNRELVGLPAAVVGGAEIASGKLPMMAVATNWLRNNQLRAGIWADRLAKAIARNDVHAVSAILGRFGVGAEIGSQ